MIGSVDSWMLGSTEELLILQDWGIEADWLTDGESEELSQNEIW